MATAVVCLLRSVAGPYDASLEEKTAWPRVRNLTALSGGKLQEAIKSSGADDVIMAQDLKAHVPVGNHHFVSRRNQDHACVLSRLSCYS